MSLFTLVIATLVGCCGVISAPLKQLLSWAVCGGESAEEKRLLQEVSSLRRSLQNISMADQFAAWAKLQRKINTITQTYQKKSSERQDQDQRVRGVCSMLVTALLSMFGLWYVWTNSSTPVIALPPHLLSPLAFLLAVPGCQPGEVSVVVWLTCVRSVIGRLSARFSSKNAAAAGGVGLLQMQAFLPLISRMMVKK